MAGKPRKYTIVEIKGGPQEFHGRYGVIPVSSKRIDQIARGEGDPDIPAGKLVTLQRDGTKAYFNHRRRVIAALVASITGKWQVLLLPRSWARGDEIPENLDDLMVLEVSLGDVDICSEFVRPD